MRWMFPEIYKLFRSALMVTVTLLNLIITDHTSFVYLNFKLAVLCLQPISDYGKYHGKERANDCQEQAVYISAPIQVLDSSLTVHYNGENSKRLFT